MDEELRQTSDTTSLREGTIKLGSLLMQIGRRTKLTDEEVTMIEQLRDKQPAQPVSFD
jgi:hypothetical protein